MEPTEDPAPPVPAAPREDLEHWLRDLRTEVVANPTDWADTDAGPTPDVPERATGGGRHRAAD